MSDADLIEEIALEIRAEMFESEDVAEHLHQAAAIRAARVILRMIRKRK